LNKPDRLLGYLPCTPESERLAKEDPSDVGMLLLHATLGPAALIVCDRHPAA
jgi:hypothetical protein